MLPPFVPHPVRGENGSYAGVVHDRKPIGKSHTNGHRHAVAECKNCISVVIRKVD